jgi:hypothetical protein
MVSVLGTVCGIFARVKYSDCTVCIVFVLYVDRAIKLNVFDRAYKFRRVGNLLLCWIVSLPCHTFYYLLAILYNAPKVQYRLSLA